MEFIGRKILKTFSFRTTFLEDLGEKLFIFLTLSLLVIFLLVRLAFNIEIRIVIQF